MIRYTEFKDHRLGLSVISKRLAVCVESFNLTVRNYLKLLLVQLDTKKKRPLTCGKLA